MEFDVFYISYDEPLADQSWVKIQNILPKAKRIHGLKGFDAAYKACASSAESARFFTIDGDNELLSPIHKVPVKWEAVSDTSVLSWPAKNVVNGLVYGNGGIKNWPKSVGLTMNTHESATTDSATVDFCYALNYLQMPDALSEAHINGGAFQAFRSGFREGVKLLLEKGIRPNFTNQASKENCIKSHVWHENLSRLKIWCSIGADAKHGLWSIYGACLGAKMLCLSDWDHRIIRDYDWFQEFWKEHIKVDETHLAQKIETLHIELNQELGLGLKLLGPKESVFFKSVYINPPRSGLMYK